MERKFYFAFILSLLFGLIQSSEANYSVKVIVKYPFISEHYIYDSLGNVTVISDSLVRSKPIKSIIFRTETEGLSQESITNDSGYVIFSFNKWQDGTEIELNNISRMAIDFPNTDRVIRTAEKITFEHLQYPDVDFRSSPEKIEIVLPMTVTKDEFTVGDPSWINSYNFAVMNDVHIGLFCSVKLTNQPLTHNKFRVKYV